MSKIENACKFMENVANDNSHGYSQTDRWGNPDYDCSGLVITACQKAGIPLKTHGATYTGNIYKAALMSGFEDVTKKVNLSTGSGLKRGDILLHENHHVAMYCGNGKEVEASINEKGKTTGGKPGDQTGKEILIRSYRNHPWNRILRYKEESKIVDTKTTTTVPDKKMKVIAKSGLNMRSEAGTANKVIQAVPYGKSVTWKHGKKKTINNVLWYKIEYAGKKGWSVAKYLK